MKLYSLFTIVMLVAIILCATPAHAYLDPGTGSMLVQALIAALAAVSVSLGIFWRRIRSIFNRILGRKDNEAKNTSEN